MSGQTIKIRQMQARIQDFLKGGGGVTATRGGWLGVIAPVGEKLLFEHTKFSATRGVITPTTTTPVSATRWFKVTMSNLPCTSFACAEEVRGNCYKIYVL